MQYEIIRFFATLSDPHRGQGQRHKLSDVLTMVTVAILNGYQGPKGFARFASSNQVELTEVLKLKGKRENVHDQFLGLYQRLFGRTAPDKSIWQRAGDESQGRALKTRWISPDFLRKLRVLFLKQQNSGA